MSKIPLYLTSFHMEHTVINIDKALEFVGDNSVYQKRVMMLFSFQWILYSFFMMGLPFLFASPVLLCKNPQKPEDYFPCSESRACESNSFIKDEVHSDHSISNEFDLYCKRNIWIGISESLFFVGSALGSFIFPIISNHKGRKFSLIITIFLSALSIILLGVSLNIYMVITLIFFVGIGLSGFETISYVYLSEISAERFRNISLVSLTSVWAFAQIIYTPISYYLANWRILCIGVIGASFVISFMFSLKFLVETPRYLISKKKFQEARLILNSIAKYNRRPNFNYLLQGEVQYEGIDPNLLADSTLFQAEEDPCTCIKLNYNYIDIFRFASLRKTTFFMFFLWFFRFLTYFGFIFSLASFGADLHENLLWTAIGELFACIISGPIKLKFTRVKSLFVFSLISSISSIILIFFPIPNYCYSADGECYQKILTLILAITIKITITIYSSILLTYTGEVYPTVVRSLGYGAALSMGKFASISMPIIITFIQNEDINPLIFFGFFGILVAALITRMNETYGKNLPNYIEENIRKKSNENLH